MIKANVKRLDGKKKLVPLTKRMENDLRSFCRDKGIESEAELVRQAIAQYIYADYSDETMKLQGLRQLKEQVAELNDKLEIIFKYLTLMHVSTLAYHPELAAEIADAALSSAEFRHGKFLNYFQDHLKDDPPLFERLLHKFYSGDNDGQD